MDCIRPVVSKLFFGDPTSLSSSYILSTPIHTHLSLSNSLWCFLFPHPPPDLPIPSWEWGVVTEPSTLRTIVLNKAYIPFYYYSASHKKQKVYMTTTTTTHWSLYIISKLTFLKGPQINLELEARVSRTLKCCIHIPVWQHGKIDGLTLWITGQVAYSKVTVERGNVSIVFTATI